MKKRPLGTLCLIVIGIIFLITEFSPEKEWEESQFPTGEIGITGTVCEKELTKEGEKRILCLEDITFTGVPLSEQEWEKVICYLAEDSKEAKLGSRVLVKGYAGGFDQATNPGQFDMQRYYRTEGISFRMSKAYILAESASYSRFREELYKLRKRMAEVLDENLAEEDAGIVKTMLLGSKGTIDSELKSLYQRNGIAHILAISGLHISLLGMGAYDLLKRLGLPVRICALAAGIFMFCYGIMTGFSVSMLRAVIMFLLHMLSKMVKRTYDMLTAAAVAAVLILAEQPLYLYDGGFVFSFGTVAGIGLVMPVLTETQGSLPLPFRSLLSGLAMAAVSYPIYLWFYYQFPPYSILLNLLVIPLMSFLMASGLVILGLSALGTELIVFPSFLIHGILKIYRFSCDICERLPGHTFTPGKPSAWQIVVYLLLLLGLVVWYGLKKKEFSLKCRWGILLIAVVILSIRPWNALEITFLDVGQGDCIYIKSRTGNCYLVDGGSTSVSEVGTYRILPFLKYQGAAKLKAVIVTHPDEDHINGILTLLTMGEKQGIQIESLILPEIEQQLENDSYRELEEAAAKAQIPVLYICAGDGIADGEMRIKCLNPVPGTDYKEPNEYSVVLELTEGKFRALFTGDAEKEGEQMILEEFAKRSAEISVTVLKVAHHGSRYATSEKMLALIKPQVSVISCGKKNVYGHPHEQTLQRLKESGSIIFSTPQNGAVTVKMEDEEILVRCYER